MLVDNRIFAEEVQMRFFQIMRISPLFSSQPPITENNMFQKHDSDFEALEHVPPLITEKNTSQKHVSDFECYPYIIVCGTEFHLRNWDSLPLPHSLNRTSNSAATTHSYNVFVDVSAVSMTL